MHLTEAAWRRLFEAPSCPLRRQQVSCVGRQAALGYVGMVVEVELKPYALFLQFLSEFA
jgi:hypothetical protein